MIIIEAIIALVFAIFSLCVVVYFVKKHIVTPKDNIDIDECIEVLKEYSNDRENSPQVVQAVENLVVVGYYPVHIMENEGHNYNDKCQQQGYRESLTNKNVRIINETPIRGLKYSI